MAFFLPCRNFRRYFYTNLQTGESQWDYPDIGTRDEASGSKKENGLTGNLAALVDDSIDRPNTKNGNNEEDLDGVAMDESDDITKVCIVKCGFVFEYFKDLFYRGVCEKVNLCMYNVEMSKF